MLSDKSQPQKTTHYIIPFVWNAQIGISTENENMLAIAWGWESRRDGIGGVTAMGKGAEYGFSFGGGEMF